jgi:RsmE family RNA methyltransferase
MNIILLHKEDFISTNRVKLSGRRFQHATSFLHAETGKTLQVGLLDGELGQGTVVALGETSLELETVFTTPPPPPLPITLILAMPRPKVLKRVLQGVTALGVKKIYLINTWRVDKSYWQSPALSKETLDEQLFLGLEQGRDTLLPSVTIEKRFKPFVEDRLPEIVEGTNPLVAHPTSSQPCPSNMTTPATLAIGPEGGFTDYEITMLETKGFTPIQLGSRALRVETAVPALIGRLMPTP